MITHKPEVAKEFNIEVATGKVAGYSPFGKFGYATDVDATGSTDIWSGANDTDQLYTWAAPTEARIHAVVSTSADDADLGLGAHTVRVYGLTSWSTDEVWEDITLAGLTPVNTVNSYVIIHRMKVLTQDAAATTANVGKISATAAVDGTVTAQIEEGLGQSMMAIVGIPSTKILLLSNFHIAILKGSASVGAEMTLKVNESPDVNPNVFLIKGVTGLTSEGSNSFSHLYQPPKVVSGPALVKITAEGSANNIRVSANLGGYLVDA